MQFQRPGRMRLHPGQIRSDILSAHSILLMRIIIDYYCEMDRRQHPHATAPKTPSAPQVVDSRTLLQAGQSVVIRHNGVLYTLRETRQGKLILTK